MNLITYQVRFAGPTNHRGARWYVVKLTTGERRHVPFDYSLGDGGEGKQAAIKAAFPRMFGAADEDRTIMWSGHKGLSTYYTEVNN